MLLYSNLPALPLSRIQREMDRMFDDVFGRVNGAKNGATAWLPAVDVREDDRGYTFEMEIPGVNPQNVEVTADDGVLTVRGEKSLERREDDKDGRWHVAERVHGAFRRSFRLPEGADENAIDATHANGVLTVKVAKVAKPEPKRIVVRTASDSP